MYLRPFCCAAVAAALAITGCASRRAPPSLRASDPPLVALKSEGRGPLRMTIEGIVVRDGPGSFTRDAKWDEYRMVLANEGGVPLVIEGLDRLGLSGPPIASSASAEELRVKTAMMQGLIAFGAVKTTAAVAGAATYVSAVGSLYSAAGFSTMGAIISTAAVVMVPVAIAGGIVAMAAYGKKADRELQASQSFEARLAAAFQAPAELGPGAEIRASVFFPIVPTSTMVVARYRVAGEPASTAIHLADWRGAEKNLASGCTMAELLASPMPVTDRALARGGDEVLLAVVESVLLRGSQESWADDAHWDEYRIRVRAGPSPITITAVRLVDAQSRVSEANRPLCPDGQPLLTAARPVLRAELEKRLTPLPAAIAPQQEAMLDLFFSMSPPPLRAEIDYTDARGAQRLEIDTAKIFQSQ